MHPEREEDDDAEAGERPEPCEAFAA